jgi:hypothetical protein
MAKMRRTKTVLTAAAALALALPAAAPAKLTEVGVIGETNPATVPSCPSSPCLAVSHTTGLQVKVATNKNLMGVPRTGTIVAWTITLGKPSATQIKYFDTNEGGDSEAALAVLQPLPKPNLEYKVIAQSPLVKLQPYFGETAQFPLETTIPVKKGDEIALTVPTWAPALALGFGPDTSWRASRAKAGCTNTSTQTAQTVLGGSAQYYCLYQTARLTYSALLISTP